MISHATTVGRRLSNEDTIAVGETENGWYHSFVGVFDGHGGDEVSNMCRDRLAETLKSTGYDLRKTILQLHENTRTMSLGCGSTAVVGLIGKTSIRIACAGDSSAFIVTSAGETIRLTRMHLASDPQESANISASGGSVQMVRGVARVDGSLMVTRSIGDRYIPSVNHVPEIVQVPRSKDYRWAVFVTDGVTDVLEDRTIGKIVYESDGNPSALVQRAYDGMSMDNCTAVVVDLA
jgi:serine/threonine protein phosphatase PrpC